MNLGIGQYVLALTGIDLPKATDVDGLYPDNDSLRIVYTKKKCDKR